MVNICECNETYNNSAQNRDTVTLFLTGDYTEQMRSSINRRVIIFAPRASTTVLSAFGDVDKTVEVDI